MLHLQIYRHLAIRHIYPPYRWSLRPLGSLGGKALVPIQINQLLGNLSGNARTQSYLNLVILIILECGRLNLHLLMKLPHALARYRIRRFFCVHLKESHDLNGRSTHQVEYQLKATLLLSVV